jgi:hypothetical protein
VPPVIYKDRCGNRLPSVTTIIGRFKESGGLLYWANQQGLEGKTLDQARAEVTTPGTLAHRAVEDHINGRPETALTGASFPNRSPPGKKAIPKSPMPSRRNEDDTDAVVSETPHLSLRYKLVG